jgi:hypothetical protein
MKASVLTVLALMMGASFAQAQLSCVQVFAPPAVRYDSKASWGQQSFERELDTIGEFFATNKKLSDADKVAALMKADVRRDFFKLEEFTRMVIKQNPQFFTEQRAKYKAVEDAIGQLDLSYTRRTTAEAIKEAKLAAYFGQQENQAQKDLITVLRQTGLMDQPEKTIAKLKKEAADKGEWMDGKKERKAFVKMISEDIRELHRSVKNNEFDNADIEKGLHELRRHLRRILQQVMALNGMVELRQEQNLPEEIGSLFSDAIRRNSGLLANKYLVTSEALVKNPILIPKYELALIVDLVGTIGDFKDNAEMQIYFREALEHSRATRPEKDAILAKLDTYLKTEPVDHRELARKIQKMLAESKLLKRLAQALEEMNDI